jgi:hypothetical protein
MGILPFMCWLSSCWRVITLTLDGTSMSGVSVLVPVAGLLNSEALVEEAADGQRVQGERRRLRRGSGRRAGGTLRSLRLGGRGGRPEHAQGEDRAAVRAATSLRNARWPTMANLPESRRGELGAAATGRPGADQGWGRCGGIQARGRDAATRGRGGPARRDSRRRVFRWPAACRRDRGPAGERSRRGGWLVGSAAGPASAARVASGPRPRPGEIATTWLPGRKRRWLAGIRDGR